MEPAAAAEPQRRVSLAACAAPASAPLATVATRAKEIHAERHAEALAEAVRATACEVEVVVAGGVNPEAATSGVGLLIIDEIGGVVAMGRLTQDGTLGIGGVHGVVPSRSLALGR